ncbi:hypothetical protein glysoja_040782, partial [Glycine soja]
WFYDYVGRKIGDGSSTLFWKDKWLGNTILKSAFLRLYRIALNKDVKVADMGIWLASGWSWQWHWRCSSSGIT